MSMRPPKKAKKTPVKSPAQMAHKNNLQFRAFVRRRIAPLKENFEKSGAKLDAKTRANFIEQSYTHFKTANNLRKSALKQNPTNPQEIAKEIESQRLRQAFLDQEKMRAEKLKK